MSGELSATVFLTVAAILGPVSLAIALLNQREIVALADRTARLMRKPA